MKTLAHFGWPLAAFCLLLTGVAGAEESPWLLGNWNGTREALGAHGVDFEFVATTDILALVDGGLDKGVEAPSNFDLVMTVDTAAAGWWENGSVLVYLLGNAGGDPSLRAGDLQVASNIEGPNTFKLFEAASSTIVSPCWSGCMTSMPISTLPSSAACS